MKTNRIIRVPINEAEGIRRNLVETGKLDHERKIKIIEYNSKRFLEIPVICSIKGFRTYDQQEAIFYRKWRSLTDILKAEILDIELEKLPSGWHIIGDIIVVSIDPCIAHLKKRIAQALLCMYPSCNTVVRDLGISGKFRLPEREILVGNSTETIHKENSCLFKIDVTKTMFSKGNLHEKALMSRIGKHETIVDMFAGIGYFTIPMAVHAKPVKIVAIELNPQSYMYLKDNISLNRVGNIVEPVNGDCAYATPYGIADRVMMGYVGTTHHYLDQGIAALKKKGGVLHYHETAPECHLFSRPISRIQEAALRAGRNADIIECRKIKKYSPGVWHVVVDAHII